MERESEIILALLKYGELHVRGISKKLSQPHANISRIMKELLKKNIVDFRFEGKNKIFKLKKGVEALNHIFIAEHFKLLKIFEKYPFLAVIMESVLSKTNEKLILIFGSYAKFNTKKESDIDLYIESQNRKIKADIENIDLRLSVKIGKFDKNSLLIKEIIKDHAIVRGVELYYEKNKVFD